MIVDARPDPRRGDPPPGVCFEAGDAVHRLPGAHDDPPTLALLQTSAEQALAAVRTDPPDLMISDIGAPGRDGLWLIAEVHALCPALPAIALTAYARDLDARQALAAGFVHHVSKSVEPQRLADLVARHRPTRR